MLLMTMIMSAACVLAFSLRVLFFQVPCMQFVLLLGLWLRLFVDLARVFHMDIPVRINDAVLCSLCPWQFDDSLLVLLCPRCWCCCFLRPMILLPAAVAQRQPPGVAVEGKKNKSTF